jgi:hypothetical protein
MHVLIRYRNVSTTRIDTDTMHGHCDVLVVTLELVLNKYTVYVVKLDKTVGMY